MQDFKKLAVWREAQALALAVYRITSHFPREEMYGLTSQIRRCATSIPANIAEGCGRGSNADLARFIQIAIGSTAELESHLLLATELGYLASEKSESVADSVDHVRRMLIAFLSKVRANPTQNASRKTQNLP